MSPVAMCAHLRIVLAMAPVQRWRCFVVAVTATEKPLAILGCPEQHLRFTAMMQRLRLGLAASNHRPSSPALAYGNGRRDSF